MSGEPQVRGRLHDREIGAGVDGPGLRYCVFLQGCPLRCQYCHNPGARALHQGTETSVEEVVADVLRYRSYLERGGVTISGGEPLAQPRFVRALLQSLKAQGLHTAVDTSGFATESVVSEVLSETDLVLLDIKHFDAARYKALTGVDLAPTLRTAKLLAAMNKPVWLRYVLVPGVTDQPDAIEGLADFAAALGCVQRVDVLPFHQLGRYKWELLGLDYALSSVREPTEEDVARCARTFASRGLAVNGEGA